MPAERFATRATAGKLLAEKLIGISTANDVLVLGLPRGGVPVAFEVAQRLDAPLDVFVVRKLGTPGQPELAMGAVATGGVRVLNPDVIQGLGIPHGVIDTVAAEEEQELRRRELAYRGSYTEPNVTGLTVVLVDDGVATGATVRAAIKALRMQEPAKIIVATPTIAGSTFDLLTSEADQVVALITPEPFHGVGEWYDDFSQTSDAEVTDLLRRARSQR